MAKRQNRNTNVDSWGHDLLDLCCDAGLLIFNGWTPGDESGEFTCLRDGGCIIGDYIVSSPTIWQATTHLELIINDIRYCALGGNSDHRSLRLRLNIDCSFVKP